MPTLADIAQARQIPFSAGIFQAVQTQAPLVSAYDARTAASTKFVSLAMTGLPTSAFANFGEGFAHSSAAFELREFEAKLLGGKVEEEIITAGRWNAENGFTGESWLAIQTQAKMASQFRHLERVMIYGTTLDAKGFPGLKELTPFVTGNTLSLTADPGATDYARTVVDAAGTTATTASSVYSIAFGPMDSQLVVANDGGGELFTVSDPVRQHIAPDASQPTKTLEHNIIQIHGFFGLSVSGMNQSPGSVVPTQYAVRRLANLTEDSGKGVTDAKLESLVMSHGDGKLPSVLVMNGRSGRQWADSRSATAVTLFLGHSGDARNNTGSIRARRPTDYEGIPIVYTSAIGSTDAIEAT